MRRLGIWGIALLAIVGCVSPQTRLQMAEEAERDKDLNVRTVGDVTEVANVGPVQVSGVGLVTGLSGTGGSPRNGYRQMLEQYLRKRKVENVTALLDSPDNALVLVTALLPAGVRHGERLDVEVHLPPGSKASSLAGGFLQECVLRNHDVTKNLNPNHDGANKLLMGHILARARGPLLVGFGADESAGLKRGRVWQGCASLVERPFYFVLKNDDKSARVANAVAERLNFMFQEDPRRLQNLSQQQKNLFLLGDVTEQINHKFDASRQGAVMAKASSKETVELRVPYGYRFNPERYLLVARLVPLREEPEAHTRYRKRLQRMLLDPAETVRAALRLEALGKESVPTLKQGLTHEHPLIRFTSAEALAYLGSTAGVDELARAAREQPVLAHPCLLALTNLDETVGRSKLSELLAEDDPELRCGAFLALRRLDEREARLGGEQLNNSFWLHKIAAGSSRLVNFAVSNRAEVVLFGGDVTIINPVRTLVGKEFAVTRESGDDRCTVSRISAQHGKKHQQCPPRLEDVIRTLADLGGEYPDVVDLLRKFEEQQCLNCPVRVNALPPELTFEALAELGRGGSLLRDVPRGAGELAETDRP